MINVVLISVVGICLGVFVGLSATPVVSTLLSAILSLITAVVAIMMGVEYPKAENRISVRPWPLASLMIGILIGSFSGLFLRTHRAFAPDPSKVISEWAALGMEKPAAARRLFDIAYPPPFSGQDIPLGKKDDSKGETAGTHVVPTEPYFYSERTKACEELSSVSDPDRLVVLLKTHTSQYWATVTKLVTAQPKTEWISSVEGICSLEK